MAHFKNTYLGDLRTESIHIILNQKRFLYSFSYKPLKINIISQENLKNHFNHSINRAVGFSPMRRLTITVKGRLFPRPIWFVLRLQVAR
jgi:hypothetical protein